MLQVEGMTVGQIEENTYVVSNEAGNALVFDPGAEAGKLIEWINTNQWKPQAILLTHTHSDHIGAVDALRDEYGIEVYVHEIEASHLSDPEKNLSANMPFPNVVQAPADRLWTEMGKKTIGDFTFDVQHIPGHSPGHVIYNFEANQFVISGDTVFNGSIGRTDFPDGSLEDLLTGIGRHILPLPGEVMLYPGHGPSTMVESELETNPYFEVFKNEW